MPAIFLSPVSANRIDIKNDRIDRMYSNNYDIR